VLFDWTLAPIPPGSIWCGPPPKTGLVLTSGPRRSVHCHSIDLLHPEMSETHGVLLPLSYLRPLMPTQLTCASSASRPLPRVQDSLKCSYGKLRWCRCHARQTSKQARRMNEELNLRLNLFRNRSSSSVVLFTQPLSAHVRRLAVEGPRPHVN